jgi:transcriptional regulator with GAF, ATPase, and Fis domain
VTRRNGLARLVASVARDLSAEPDVQHTLQRVVDLTAEHQGEDMSASISLVHKDNRIETPVFSDERAEQADQLQYALNDGPCLDAIRRQDTFLIRDMTTETRYEHWCRRVAADIGIRSSLSFQLFTGADSLGALNIYCTRPDGFDEEAREQGWVFAAQAAVALQGAQTEQALRSGLATRNLVGQAMGILMERHKITAARAFDILRTVSQQSNVKLHEIARMLAETGEVTGERH